MKEVLLKDIITIIHRTINEIDNRLLEHGEQVAYIMMNLLKEKGTNDESEIIDLCIISMFHDIGIHKVSEVRRLLNVDCYRTCNSTLYNGKEVTELLSIDSLNPFEHAIYGALFIKYFSPLSKLYKVVLGHHFTYKYIKFKNIDIPIEALMLGLSDYFSVLVLNNKELSNYEIKKMSKIYTLENVQLLLDAINKNDINTKLRDKSYKSELYDFLKNKRLKREEVLYYARMLAYAIDFRSEVTVKHSIIVEAISYEIGKLLGLDEKLLYKLKISGILHDIGKISIPVHILEKDSKLTDEEFEAMKEHAIIGYYILSGLNIDDIRDIATLHHEKIDGSGYPFGLKGDELSIEIRILAIADILSALVGRRSYKESFSKDRVINILKEMSNNNKIDKDITNLVILNYDSILNMANIKSSKIINIYLDMKKEYKDLLNTL